MKDSTIKKRIRICIKDDCTLMEIFAATAHDCDEDTERAKRLVVAVLNNSNLTEQQVKEITG